MRSIFLLDPAAKVFSEKEKKLYFLVAAFLITLLLPDMPVINNIVIGALFLYCLFYNTVAEKKQFLRQRKEIPLMIAFFGLHIISAFFSVDKKEAFHMIVLRLPLLVFPLSLGLVYIREELRDRIWLFYSILITVTAVICMAWAIRLCLLFHDAGYLYDDSLTIAIRRQSIYFALMVNLALFSYIYLLTKSSSGERGGHPVFSGNYKVLAWLSVAFLLVFHFMLASRIAIITLYSSLLIYALVYQIIQKKKFGQGLVLIFSLLAAAFVLVTLFPKTLNRFNELNYTAYQFNSHAVESHYNMQLTPEQWNGANIRLAVWKCGWELARHHWLFGVQLGDKQAMLREVYKARHFDFALSHNRNMHNNYLDIFSCFGLIGLLLFLPGYFIIPLAGTIKAGDLLGLFTIAALAASLISETYMDRSIGCLLLGFFLSFISSGKNRSLLSDGHLPA
jgi:O-antigen ligase